MIIAWKEITHHPKKFILIELLIIVMMFMVVFLTGLTNGLGRAVSSQIENYGKVTYLLSSDSEGLITFSTMTDKQLDELKKSNIDTSNGLAIQRASISQLSSDKKEDVTYFAIENGQLLEPKLTSGQGLFDQKNSIVLDQSFEEKGIQIGDVVKDAASKKTLVVSGFAKDAMYGHSPVAFISNATFETLRKESLSSYQWAPQAYLTKKPVKAAQLPEGIKSFSQKTIISKIPGYAAENMTLTMITWVLLIASSAILGVFFYILTLQKLKQFGVLKAIGMSMTEIAGIQLSQIGILAFLGLGIGVAVATLLAQILPASMPFYLVWSDVFLVTASFFIIAMICGCLTLLKVKQVDPVQVISGNEE